MFLECRLYKNNQSTVWWHPDACLLGATASDKSEMFLEAVSIWVYLNIGLSNKEIFPTEIFYSCTTVAG